MRRWPAILALGLLACSQTTTPTTPVGKLGRLGGQAGVYLYTNSGRLLKVANSPAYASLANGCF